MNFFKQKEQKPFAYSSIEMRKSSRGYYKWVAIVVLVIVLLFLFFSDKFNFNSHSPKMSSDLQEFQIPLFQNVNVVR